jgi:hypothetical protein
VNLNRCSHNLREQTKGMMLSHVAAALALASCVAADVPAFCNGPACRGSGPSAPSARSAGGLAPRMVAQDYLAGLQGVVAGSEDAGAVPAWTAPAGYKPHASQVEPPPAAETSSVAKWAAPVGYAPMRAAQSADQAGVARSMVQAWGALGGREPSASMSAPPVEDAEAVMARVNEMMVAKASTSAPLTAPSAPARHRQIFGGYDPKSRIQSAPAQLYQASAMPLTCEVADAPRLPAPSAKPEPWASAPVMSAPPVEDAEAVMARVNEMMVARASTSAPLQAPSAPARHRQIFGGYDPKSRIQSAPAQLYQASAMTLTCEVADAPRLPAPSAKPEPWAAASAPTKESVSMETHPAAESARGAPAKTWQPYGGYVPRSRKTEEDLQDTLSASTPQDVHASTHVPSTTTSTVMAHELWRQRLVNGLATAEAASDAQHEMDVLASIKNEFLARLDAAGSRAAGEHTLANTRARMSMYHPCPVSEPLEREGLCGAESEHA